MRHVIGYVSILALLAIAPAGYAVDLLNVPMGSQIDNGKSTCWYWASTTLTPALNPDSGAIYVPAPYTGGDTQDFKAAGIDPISGLNEPEPFLRHNIATTTGHYFYQAVSFNLADAGAGCESGALDLSAPCARLEFDVRYYKSDGNYADAPVAAVLQCFGWDAGSSRYIEVGRRTLGPGGWVYRVGGDAPYPTWTHVVAYVNVDYVDSGRNGGTFNIAQVDGIRFHGTDWTSTGFDFVDFKNLVISDDTIPAPSITPMPNPDSATVRTEYVRQLDGGDGKCDPTMNWTLVTGPSGMVISQTGKLSGWTPSISDSGTSVTVTVTATNSAGSDTESWTVQVVGFSELVNISMDNQIDLGQGDAIVAPAGCAFTFEDPADSETTDRFARYHLTSTCGCGGYYGYGNDIHIDLTKAGYAPIDVTGCQTRFKIDLRYYQLAGTYSDAPVFARFSSSNGGVRDYGIVYGASVPEGERYPIWKHVSMATDDTTAQPYTDSGSFDPGQVVKISFWGTDWSGSPSCQDYVDFNNVIITNVPPAPSLVPVAPDPENVYIGMPYTRQIMLVECTVVDWSISGLPGATIDENGLINWTPNSLGTYNATVTAANGSGSASDSWTVNVAAVPPTSDGSNVAQPWGTIHGNIYATQSSDDPSLLFDSRWSNAVKVDWAYTATVDGLTGGTERGGISFDENGNLYWKTTEGLLASLAPDKTLRWKGNVAGTPVDLGEGDTTTPVVGDGGETGRVYVLGDSGLYAFQKSDGAQLWAAALPDANFASTGDRLTPALYDGRVYVVGAGLTMKTVYEIDAATGTIVWAKPIAVNLDTGWGDAKGAMTLVPNALGAGIHGLYFNADGSGDGTDVYCIAINTSTYSGSLQWMADGGKVVRSHVIYSATTGRLYTATWGDDGKQFYSFSPTTGLLVGNNSPEGSGHGYNDFGVLDFNGTDVIAAGFGGNVIRYHDTGDGSTAS
ncbi:MAG: PQQ-binding-like beta-propeller repeat protein, partial [Phycisphaerae bacterium]|nr:PQQ-binding-like beta-propeller repeat protein [Phycisphaerae bacterium]